MSVLCRCRLVSRLEAWVAQINPSVPEEARSSAIRQVLIDETPVPVEENRRLHRLVTEGVNVEYRAGDGRIVGDKVWLIDFDNITANDWLVVNPFTMIEGAVPARGCRLFVNGLPLAVLELKNPGDEKATLSAAFRQNPAGQKTNLLVVSHQCGARYLRRDKGADRLVDGE